MEKAIERAIEGGYRGNFVYQNPENDQWSWNEDYPVQFALFQPDFWKCLGKAGVFPDEIPVTDIYNKEKVYKPWKEEWHEFIDHLAEGKDINSFFTTLLK